MKGELSLESQISLRIAHLEMIQGAISRMSGFSATAKNFAVTVCAAIAVIAFDKESPELIVSAIVAVAVFLIMDAYYHLLEVRFRELYNITAEAPLEAGSDLKLDPPKTTPRNRIKTLKSATLFPFYVPLLFALLIAFTVARDGRPSETKPPAVGNFRSPSEATHASTGRAGPLDDSKPASPERVGEPIRSR